MIILKSTETALSSYIANVPRLKERENYNDWAFSAENFLVLQEKMDSVKIENTLVANNATTKDKLILTIEPSLYVHIKDSATIKYLWI